MTTKLVIAFVLMAFSALGIFIVVLETRTRRRNEERERPPPRRLRLGEWRQHNRFRSVEGKKPRTPRPANTERAHKRPPERRNIP